MTDEHPYPDRSGAPPTPPPSLPPLRASISSSMRSSEHSDWLTMMRAQPWRRETPPPPAPPRGQQYERASPPPVRGSLHQPQGQHSFDDQLGAYAPHRFVPSSDARMTSTAMRFLARELPRQAEQRAPSLRQEDRQEDARATSYASERSAFPSALPSLRRWGTPPLTLENRTTAVLPSLSDHHSISPYSDTTLPSSGSSTPIDSSLQSVQSLTQDHRPRAWSSPRSQSVPLDTSSSRYYSREGSSPLSQASTWTASTRPRFGTPFTTADRPPERVVGDTASASPQTAAPKKKKKRTPRLCTTPGCDKLVVDHGVCIRHGGGKRCNVEGCTCRAQNRGLCWKHGGYTICRVDGCDKRAKSRGMCWSHGGGTQCKTDGCEKIAVSRGCCWAHGGGKRCKIPDCKKPAALRMDDFCAEHHAQHRASQAPQPTRSRDDGPMRRYADLQDQRLRR